MSLTFMILARPVPLLSCCLAAAVIVLVGASPRLKALGGAGALMMVAAEATQLVVNLSPHDGVGWLWIPQVVSLFFVAGLVLLGVAATSPPVQESGPERTGMPMGQPWPPPGYPPAGPTPSRPGGGHE